MERDHIPAAWAPWTFGLEPTFVTQRAPSLLAIRGEAWTAATDGRAVLAVRGGLDGLKREDWASIAEKYLTVPLPERLSLPDLLAWTDGYGMHEVACDCQGVSYPCVCPKCEHVHESDCGECDGSGVLVEGPEFEAANGVLLDAVIDRRALHHLLRHPAVVGSLVPTRPAHMGTLEPMVLGGSGWGAVLMPVNLPGDGLPSFGGPGRRG